MHTALFACSGPGAARAIANHQIGAKLCLLATIVVVAFVIFRRKEKRNQRLWLLLFGLVHPGWWMSSRGGDCGFLLFYSSIAVTVVSLLAAFGWYRWTRNATEDEDS